MTPSASVCSPRRHPLLTAGGAGIAHQAPFRFPSPRDLRLRSPTAGSRVTTWTWLRSRVRRRCFLSEKRAGSFQPKGIGFRQTHSRTLTARDRLPAAERLVKLREKVRRTWNEFAVRHWCEHVDFMADIGLLREEVAHYHVAHHRAHAASAFHLSGLTEPAAILTCDGKGDGLSATVYRGDPDGGLNYLRGSAANDSVGLFYQAVTEALGFVPVDGEYKTMGLAAFGQVLDRANPFDGIVSVRDGILASSRTWTSANYNERHPERKVNNPLSSVAQADEFQRLLARFSDRDLAYFAQAHLEEVLLRPGG